MTNKISTIQFHMSFIDLRRDNMNNFSKVASQIELFDCRFIEQNQSELYNFNKLLNFTFLEIDSYEPETMSDSTFQKAIEDIYIYMKLKKHCK